MLYWYIYIMVQVVIESLPLSSSGHVQLVNDYWKLTQSGYPDDKLVASLLPIFDALLHLPTMIMIAFFYRKRVIAWLRHPRRFFFPLMRMAWLTVITDSITVLFFYAKQLGWFPVIPLYYGLCVTMLLIFSLTLVRTGNRTAIYDRTLAVILGCVQGVALLPGISRFASTYVVAVWYGCRPEKAFALSWMIHYPLMGVSVLKACYDLVRMPMVIDGGALMHAWYSIGTVIMISLLFGYGALVVSYTLAVTERWYYFGYYLMALIGILILFTS